MLPSKEDKEHMENFFYELQFVLPCEKCKYTFKQHYNKYPIIGYLENKLKLIEWLELIYEETNRSIANNRVKIMDEFIDTGEMLPLKQIHKSDADKILEQHIQMARREVINGNVNNNIVTLPQYNEQLSNANNNNNDVGKQKVHNLGVPVQPFGKSKSGKKNPKTSKAKGNNKVNNAQIPMAIPVPKPSSVGPAKVQTNTIDKLNVQEQVKIQPKSVLPPNIKTYPTSPKTVLPSNVKTYPISPKTVLPPKVKNYPIGPKMIFNPHTGTQTKPHVNSNMSAPIPNFYQKMQVPSAKPNSVTYSNLTIISKCGKCK
jgi:hypothetical protein